jgi:hypothetical protein
LIFQTLAVLETTASGVGRTSRANADIAVAVDIAHLCGLFCPIFWTILNDAQGVDPQIIE